MPNSDMNPGQVLPPFILKAREPLEDMDAAPLRVALPIPQARGARTGACARGADS